MLTGGVSSNVTSRSCAAAPKATPQSRTLHSALRMMIVLLRIVRNATGSGQAKAFGGGGSGAKEGEGGRGKGDGWAATRRATGTTSGVSSGAGAAGGAARTRPAARRPEKERAITRRPPV